MTINVLWIVLALGIGLGTDQSIERNSITPQFEWDNRQGDDCYRNGIWYNPCPPEYVPPPLPGTPGDPNYQ